MKLILRNILCVLLIACLTGACNDVFDEKTGLKPYLQCYSLAPSVEQISCSSHQQAEHFKVISSNTPWRISNGNSWFRLSPMSGTSSEEVQVDIDENLSGDTSRIGIFSLNSEKVTWQYAHELYVKQLKADVILEASTEDLFLNGLAQSREIYVTANVKWIAETSAYWLDLEQNQETGLIKVKVSENRGERERKAVVSVSDHNENKIFIHVTQYPTSVNISDTEMKIGNTAAKLLLDLKAESAWKAESSAEWISVDPTEGNAGNHSLTIVTLPNMQTHDRTGYVTFYSNDIKKAQLEIQQRGLYLETSVERLDATSFDGKYRFGILSNSDWKITSFPDWMSLSVEAGFGDKEVEVTVKDNANVASRMGNIHIEQVGTELYVNLEVFQKGKNFEFLQTTLSFGSHAGVQVVPLVAEMPWTISTVADWISVTPDKGALGNYDVSIAVEENNSGNDRRDNLFIDYYDQEQLVNVFQKSKYFVIDDNLFDFPSKGGVVDVSFTTDDEWTIVKDSVCDWIHLSVVKGIGDSTVTLSIADNPSLSKRETELLIKTKGCRSTKIVVRQKERYLRTDVKSCYFFNQGGESEIIKVDTDAAYEVTCSDSWFIYKKVGIDHYCIEAADNPYQKTRKGNLMFTMTDLDKDTYRLSIPVVQFGESSDFELDDFQSDVHWDVVNKDSLSFRITGFAEDADWNKNGEGNSIIDIEIFDVDDHLDQFGEGNSSLDKDDFDSEGQLGEQDGDSVLVDLGPFDSDTNLDDGIHKDDTLHREDFQPDESLQNDGNNDSSIGKENFDKDENQNDKDGNGSSVDRENFHKDECQDNKNANDSSIGKDGFQTDTDLDHRGKDDSTIGKDGFKPDEDLNSKSRKRNNTKKKNKK